MVGFFINYQKILSTNSDRVLLTAPDQTSKLGNVDDAVDELDAVNLRQLRSLIETITGIKIQDNGTELPSREYLNFIGDGFTITDDPTNNRINITIDTPSGGDVPFTDDFVVSLSNGKTFGKYLNGQTVPAAGKTAREVLLDIAIEYIAPTFTTFYINGQSQLIEVGTALSGSKTFVWGTSNPSNIQPNSIAIRDLTSNTVIGSSLTNDGSEIINIGTITNTSPISRSWRAEAVDIQATPFNSGAFGVNSIYPYFYGKVASGGAAPGLNRPVANQALINSGTKVLASSTGAITINFDTTSDQYGWFAIPNISPSRSTWYVSALNTGPIGGAVSSGGNLFPNPDVISIDSPTALWTGVSYKVYIFNYQSANPSNMTLS